MSLEFEIKNGTIPVFNKNDYFAGEINIPRARNNFWDKLIQFNQNAVDPYGCCYHSGYGCVCDNNKDILDDKGILKLLESLKYDYGYTDGYGMYLYKAVDMVRDTVNKIFGDDKLITYRIKNGSEQFYEALDKGYSIHTVYKGNKKYNIDKKDGVLDENEFGDTTYGHSIRITKKGGLFVIDNYNIGAPIEEDDNVYEIKDIQGLIDNKVYWEWGYIYIFKNDIGMEANKDIEMIEYALEHGITNNKQNLEDIKKGNYTVDVRMALMNARVHNDLSNKINK